VDQFAVVHHFMREELTKHFGQEDEAFRLLYGGSVSPANAKCDFRYRDVDGA
jgi:triosephosphate isomerase